MDRNTLLIFAKRIFDSGSTTKANLSLLQLKTLLEEQGSSEDNIRLIDRMLACLPEMQEISKKDALSMHDIQVAERRANERKAREAAARHYGRC